MSKCYPNLMFKSSGPNTPKQQYEKKLDEMSEIIKDWNLSDTHKYVMCKNNTHVCNFLGFDAIMQKFNTQRTSDKDFPDGRHLFEIGDRPERTKKGLEIVIMLCKHPRSNIKTMLGIQQFLKIYMDVVRDYDKTNSKNYRQRLLHAFRKGLFRLEAEAKKKRTSPTV